MGRAENMAAYAARIKERKMAEDVNWGKLLATVSEIFEGLRRHLGYR